MNLLLVEDNPGDVRLTQEALMQNELDLKLHVAFDGEQALDFLYKRAGYENSPRPDLILMDINIPKYSGIEVLEKIKGDPTLKKIPVVMLTTSDTNNDVSKCYELGANAYTIKPLDFENFITMINSIYNFWFMNVKLPKD
jgi:chemotaxis family two-component system response regulator Rcp1